VPHKQPFGLGGMGQTEIHSAKLEMRAKDMFLPPWCQESHASELYHLVRADVRNENPEVRILKFMLNPKIFLRLLPYTD
jgi:hypothetical protein